MSLGARTFLGSALVPALVSVLACTCGGDSAKVMAMKAMCPGPSMDPASSTVIGSACMELGLGYNNGLYGSVDEPEARKYYRWGCDVNSEGSCYNLGRMEEKGEGGEVDLVRALAHYEQSCHLGYDEGCAAGFMLENDPAILVGPCERGDNRSCFLLARELDDSDPERAAMIQRQACDRGYAHSCFSYGINLVAGRGVEKDKEQGMAIWSELCDAGHASSCGTFGMMTDDLAIKRDYLQQSCTLGDGPGCMALADISEGELAVELQERACELGLQRACGL